MIFKFRNEVLKGVSSTKLPNHESESLYLDGRITCILLQERRDIFRMILRLPHDMMRIRSVWDFLLYSLPGPFVLLTDTADTSLPSLDLRHLLNKVLATCPGIPCFW
jgi:hypothetical protein